MTAQYDALTRLMGPFSVFTVFVGVISCFGAVDKTSSLVFQRTVNRQFHHHHHHHYHKFTRILVTGSVVALGYIATSGGRRAWWL